MSIHPNRPSEPEDCRGPGEIPPTEEVQAPLAGESLGAGPASAGPAESESPDRGSAAPPRRRFSASERQQLLTEFAQSGLTAAQFAGRHGVRVGTFDMWLRRARRPARPSTRSSRRYTPEQRRGAVEAFLKAGRTREDFAALWGCSTSSLDKWLRRYQAEGPKGLTPGVRVVAARSHPDRRPPTRGEPREACPWQAEA